MMQIFRPQRRAVRAQCRGDYQRVIDRHPVTLGEFQCLLMGGDVEWRDLATLTHRRKKFSNLANLHAEFSDRNRGELVEDLDADGAAALQQLRGAVRLRRVR